MLTLLLVFTVGFLSHLVSALVGGGGLISLPTMLLIGIPIHSAIAADKFGAVISTLLTTLQSLKRKEVTLREVSTLIIVGLASGFVGGLVANLLSEELLNFVAIGLMGFAFIMSFFSKSFFGTYATIQHPKKVYPLLSGVGFYDGLFGPGSSTLAIYAFSSDKLQYFKAVTYTRISLFAWCAGALVSYISAGALIWPIALAVTGGAVLGGFVGVYLSKRVNVKYIKHVLRVMTFIIIVQLLLKLL